MNRFTSKTALQCCVIACIVIVIINTTLLLSFNHRINFITACITTATDKEYTQIAQEIRHDLIYHSDIKELIQYIPNTTTDCPTCKDFYPYSVYFLAINTGELYCINTVNKLTGEQFSFSSGYDEISQTKLNIIYNRTCTASINQKLDTISIHRMKTIFCDDCIDKILAVIDLQDITSFVIFIPQEQAFYPISKYTEISLENIAIEIYYDKEMREMITELSW